MRVENLAISIEDRFVEIHEIENYEYDFSIYDENCKLLDGGVVEGGTIGGAIVEIIHELQSNTFNDSVRGKISSKSKVVFLNHQSFMNEIERKKVAV